MEVVTHFVSKTIKNRHGKSTKGSHSQQETGFEHNNTIFEDCLDMSASQSNLKGSVFVNIILPIIYWIIKYILP